MCSTSSLCRVITFLFGVYFLAQVRLGSRVVARRGADGSLVLALMHPLVLLFGVLVILLLSLFSDMFTLLVLKLA